jgi:HEAT repeat protein
VVVQVERLLLDSDPGVRSEALLYLARMTDVDPLARLGDLDQVDDSSVASAMATFLGRSGPGQNLEAVGVLLDAAIAHRGPGGELARLQAARLIGSLAGGFDGQLQALLQDPAPEVVRSAIRAAGALGGLGAAGSAPLLVARLGDPLLSADAADALAALGEAAVPALGRALTDDSAARGLRDEVPDVLRRIGTPAAEHVLVESLLDANPILRLRVVSALNKVRQLNPERRFEPDLVKTVLAAEILGHYRSYQILGTRRTDSASSEASAPSVDDAMAREIERIFRLMKVLLPGDDWHSAYFGLRSVSPAVHANALEFLEHTLPPQLRTLLLPLIDSEVTIADRVKIANQILGTVGAGSEHALAAFAATEALRDVARTTALGLEGDVERAKPKRT